MADAAATIVANAVDLPKSPNIHRAPASSISSDSDLGDLLVTQSVAALSVDEIECALNRGAAVAQHLRSEGLIHSAALHLQGETRIVAADRRVACVLSKLKLSRSRYHA
jgi:ApbE superfamily uncharacterized protein (UPF0280 family)